MYIFHFAKLKKILQCHLYSDHPHSSSSDSYYNSSFLSASSDDQSEVSLMPWTVTLTHLYLYTMIYWSTHFLFLYFFQKIIYYLTAVISIVPKFLSLYSLLLNLIFSLPSFPLIFSPPGALWRSFWYHSFYIPECNKFFSKRKS